ncbi:MAG: quinolinate synthase NadA [Lachnospiraceae bacterium]|nr:quinolinate synthase NadA [Lachnospiraceae bacterium]
MNELQEKILALKEEKGAAILAHYYVPAEIQEIADCVGDSFFLAKKAKSLPNETLVFCGVNFMGESAKMMNPEKTVLMPDLSADCPMAHMVTKETVDAAKAEYDDLAVVCYINSTAEIKSWSDVCVTSANAVKVVKELPQKNILFIPDRNLAHFVASQCPDKNFIYNEGYCPRHEFMSAEEVAALKEEHPDALVLAHPECNPALLAYADHIASTSGIINYAKDSDAKEFIIGTEIGVYYALKQARPDASFYFTPTQPICVNMKKNTLEKLYQVLSTGENAVEMPAPEVVAQATKTLDQMLELAAK